MLGVRSRDTDTRDKLRYEYEHSILGYEASEWDGNALESGHRLSVMIRVRTPWRAIADIRTHRVVHPHELHRSYTSHADRAEE